MDLFEAFFARCPQARGLAAEVAEKRAREAASGDSERIGAYLDYALPMLPSRPSERPVSYLDTGCGVGASLQAASDRGIKAIGIEVDQAALAVARRRGFAVYSPEDAFPPGPYDLLTFFESLEHMDDPRAVLERYGSTLAQNGLVLITVPNAASLTIRILRGDCSYVHGGTNSPGHINLFDFDSLSILLESAGLTPVSADTQYSDNPFELAAYLASGVSPVASMLGTQRQAVRFPETTFQALNSVWPAVALIQRIGLCGPILQVLACRTQDLQHFEGTRAEIRERRRIEIHELAQAIQSQSTGYVERSRTPQARDRGISKLTGMRARWLARFRR